MTGEEIYGCAAKEKRVLTKFQCQNPRPRGAEGDRTLDLVNAIHALSQLSYSPG